MSTGKHLFVGSSQQLQLKKKSTFQISKTIYPTSLIYQCSFCYHHHELQLRHHCTGLKTLCGEFASYSGDERKKFKNYNDKSVDLLNTQKIQKMHLEKVSLKKALKKLQLFFHKKNLCNNFVGFWLNILSFHNLFTRIIYMMTPET